MTAQNSRQQNQVKVKSTHPTTPNTANHTYKNDSGLDKDAWFREEEIMRKKLEK